MAWSEELHRRQQLRVLMCYLGIFPSEKNWNQTNRFIAQDSNLWHKVKTSTQICIASQLKLFLQKSDKLQNIHTEAEKLIWTFLKQIFYLKNIVYLSESAFLLHLRGLANLICVLMLNVYKVKRFSTRLNTNTIKYKLNTTKCEVEITVFHRKQLKQLN